MVIGWDATAETADYLARGLITLAVEQDPGAMGSRAVEALEAYLRRDLRPSKRLLTPFALRMGGDTVVADEFHREAEILSGGGQES